MFVRVKRSGPHEHLQIVRNRRKGKRVRQTVVATLGRLDRLAASGVHGLDLHHMYRAMGWLGEPLDASETCGPAPRRTRDLVEEALLARRRDLFTNLDLVLFDTTSLHVTGLGGETLGRFGVRRVCLVADAGRIARRVGVRLPKAVRRIAEENAGTST